MHPLIIFLNFIYSLIIFKPGHGSTPHLCHNPITIGANIVNAINQITSQEIDSKERSIISIGQFCSGETHNVIPENGIIKGSIRTITPNTAEKIKNRIASIAEGNAKIFESEIKVEFECVGDLTWNHPQPTKIVQKVAEKFFKIVNRDLPFMASEDFSFYQREIPGCFFILGCGDALHQESVHTSVYDFNDKAIPLGIEMYIRILEEKFNLKLI